MLRHATSYMQLILSIRTFFSNYALTRPYQESKQLVVSDMLKKALKAPFRSTARVSSAQPKTPSLSRFPPSRYIARHEISSFTFFCPRYLSVGGRVGARRTAGKVRSSRARPTGYVTPRRPGACDFDSRLGSVGGLHQIHQFRSRGPRAAHLTPVRRKTAPAGNTLSGRLYPCEPKLYSRADDDDVNTRRALQSIPRDYAAPFNRWRGRPSRDSRQRCGTSSRRVTDLLVSSSSRIAQIT